jgi:hypothetical protein
MGSQGAATVSTLQHPQPPYDVMPASLLQFTILNSVVNGSHRWSILLDVVAANRYLEGEYRAFTRTVALGRQRTLHLHGSQRATMETESVAAFSGRKTVCKYSGEIFWRDSLSVVRHPNP